MDTTNVKRWVLLVAGSNGWTNYCDQANVCHAYQIVLRNGIPAEQIVVMMYDDIADSDKNPTPGVLISTQSGLNVYEGVQKDYTGKDVTPANFLSVLTGNEAAVHGIGSGRVIKSKPQDNIFVYFSGHGSEGQLSFPDFIKLFEIIAEHLFDSLMSVVQKGENNVTVVLTSEDMKNEMEQRNRTAKLTEEDFIVSIKKMAQRNQFSKMVIYLNACHSGSMFKSLPNNIKVYAVVSAAPGKPSYKSNFDKKRNVHLSDEFNASWMAHINTVNLPETTTLETQFSQMRIGTKSSDIQQYGDLTISQEKVSCFQGNF